MQINTFGGDGRFIGKMDQTSDVENRLGGVVENEEAESKSSKVHGVSGSDANQVNSSICDSCWHVFTLDLLEIQLGVGVKPVSQLDNEEKLEHERHGNVGVIPPKS